MPQIPITSALGWIGIFFMISGVFLIMSGIGIIKVEKITITQGRTTWAFGTVLAIIGFLFLIPEVNDGIQSISPTPTPTTTDISTNTSADPANSVVPQTSETQQASTPNLATIDIYDSFDNPTHNGYFNQALWVTNIQTGDVAIFQANGRLTFQTVDSNNGLGSWINLVDGTEVSLQDYNAIEVKFSWDPQINGQLFLGLTAEQSWSPKVAYICDFLIATDTSLLMCEGTDEEQIHSPSDRVLASNRVYTLRFEIDPTTATFVIYLDGTVIDTYIPPNPEKWLQGTVAYNIHLGAEPNSSATAYIDEVRFGRIK